MRRGSQFLVRLVLGALIVAAPLLALHAYNVRQAFKAATQSAAASVQARSALLGQSMELLLSKTNQLLGFLADRPEIQDRRWSACSSMLEGVHRLDETYDGLALVDMQGRLLCASSSSTRSSDFTHPSFLQEVVERPADVHGAYLPSVGADAGGYVLARFVGDSAGQPIGVLALRLNMKGVSRYLTPDALGDQESVSLFLADGTVIARVPGFERWVGQKISPQNLRAREASLPLGEPVEMRSLEGDDKVFATVRVDPFALYLSAGVPVEKVYAQPWLQLKQTALTTVGVLLVVALLAYYQAKWLSRPLRLMSGAFRVREQGASSRQVPENLPFDFAEVAREYNKIAARRDEIEDSLREAQRQTERLREFTAALSSINQLVVRRPEPQQLYEGVCKVCVDTRHAHMAWVGLLRDNEVVPVAWGGQAKAYTDIAGPFHLGRDPASDGVTVRAVRTGQVCVANDYSASPLTAEWRERASRFGIRSSVALPLKQMGATIGAISLYATERGFFTDELLALLTDLVNDVSFGLDDRARELERIARIEKEEVERAERLRAEAANQAKTEFLARMSHELRTPLNAVLGFAQLLQLTTQSRLSESERKHLDHIFTAGAQLKALIDDVLDMSRLEAGVLAVELKDFSVASVVADVQALTQPLAVEKGVTLTAQPGEHAPLMLRTDPLRLRQVLVNLVTNAIKYNHSGGRATLGVERRLGRLDFVVRDNGMGMTEEQLEKIYQPFNRLGREASGIEGTGIGMAITRQLVELLGGQLGMESVPGRGTTARVSLPFVQSEQAVAPAARRLALLPGTAPQRPAELAEDAVVQGKVLYVEDNPVNVALVAQLLRRWPKVRLEIAENGERGLECARRVPPDVVLLDMQLPDMSGCDVLRALKADEATRGLQVVALSASAMEHEVQEALNAGALAYWTKPLDLVQFLTKLRALLPLPQPSEKEPS